MSNSILIIGNGFDLYHKLPTRYTDFLFFVENWDVFKRIYDERREGENQFKQEMGNPQAQFEVRLDDNGKLIDVTLEDFANHPKSYDIHNLHFLNEHLLNNSWIEYFLNSNYKKEGWIDFECEMEKVLLSVEKYYCEELPKYEGKLPHLGISSDIVNKINIFGKNAEEPFRSMNSRALRRIDLEYELLQEQKLALLNSMKIEMDILNKCLYLYLSEFVSKIKCNVYSKQIMELENVQLLNFNYTQTYEIVYGKQLLLEQHPIHGNLESDNLVLGISDHSFQNLDYIYFQKYFQRIQKRTGSYYKNWIKCKVETFSDEATNVHILGHSLDKTDKGILNDIFKSDCVEVIYIYYHNQLAYENQVINLINMFGREYIIEQTAEQRIEFVKLEPGI